MCNLEGAVRTQSTCYTHWAKIFDLNFSVKSTLAWADDSSCTCKSCSLTHFNLLMKVCDLFVAFTAADTVPSVRPLFTCHLLCLHFLPLLRQLQRSAPLCQRLAPPPQIKPAPPLPPKMELLPQQPVKLLHQPAQRRLLAPVLPLQPKSLWVQQMCSHTHTRIHTCFWWLVFVCVAYKCLSLWVRCVYSVDFQMHSSRNVANDWWLNLLITVLLTYFVICDRCTLSICVSASKTDSKPGEEKKPSTLRSSAGMSAP